MIKPHCIFSRPLATAPWLCSQWVKSLTGEWFCLSDVDHCETRGLRFTVKVGQEDDGFQDSVDLGVP